MPPRAIWNKLREWRADASRRVVRRQDTDQTQHAVSTPRSAGMEPHRSSFENLPSEILAKIGEHLLDGPDIKKAVQFFSNYRLTSRRLNNLTKDFPGLRHVSLVTQGDMLSLRNDVTQHYGGMDYHTAVDRQTYGIPSSNYIHAIGPTLGFSSAIESGKAVSNLLERGNLASKLQDIHALTNYFEDIPQVFRDKLLDYTIYKLSVTKDNFSIMHEAANIVIVAQEKGYFTNQEKRFNRLIKRRPDLKAIMSQAKDVRLHWGPTASYRGPIQLPEPNSPIAMQEQNRLTELVAKRDTILTRSIVSASIERAKQFTAERRENERSARGALIAQKDATCRQPRGR